jgi:hypothetical protein
MEPEPVLILYSDGRLVAPKARTPEELFKLCKAVQRVRRSVLKQLLQQPLVAAPGPGGVDAPVGGQPG